MRVTVEQAEVDLPQLLVRAEAGEEIEIARDGVPVVRLVRIDAPVRPGQRFFAARGSLAGQIVIGEDFESTDAEVDESLDEPV